jgi:hypothetical protein
MPKKKNGKKIFRKEIPDAWNARISLLLESPPIAIRAPTREENGNDSEMIRGRE